MNLDINFIASIAERDIDLVVMEELSVSEEFQEWFVTRTYGPQTFAEYIGAWHSVTDSTFGETDILFVCSSENGQRIAILIENKISAPPQPEQGARYRLRGEKGISEGYWEEFCTVAIAPERYLESSQHTEIYDHEVSYEELLAFFSSRRFRDERFSYKARIVREAIEQNRRGYQPEYDDNMTAFVSAYYEKYGRAYPKLAMQEPKPRPANSDWIVFKPKGYPDGIWLCHQLFPGKVKAFFDGGASQLQELSERYVPALRPDMELGEAGKSAAITISVAKIRPSHNAFAEEQDHVEAAMEAIMGLDAIIRSVEGITDVQTD